MSLERRSAQERESLIFKTSQEAHDFRESIERRANKNAVPGVTRKRELVAEELVAVFEAQGVGVKDIKEPWSHTPIEHEEVQKLVNIAFSHDIGFALKHARESKFFPRNIDLFYDVLTGEMYEAVLATEVNKHHPSWIFLLAIFVIFIGLLASILLFVYSL